MGYLKIGNLYKTQEIFLFRECYVLEKVHGTSAHISFNNKGELGLFSGGEKHSNFVKLFNKIELIARFKENTVANKVTIFGEAYGGRQQGMSSTYGKELKFIVFDIRVGECWLDVPNMFDLATKLGLEVVPFHRTETTPEKLDYYRDLKSEVAIRRGMGTDKDREGIVIRPLIELTMNNGQRVIAKHKGEKFQERLSQPKLVDPQKQKILEDANEIANEWVVPNRLQHILQKYQENDIKIENMGNVIKSMVEDIYLEAKGEILESIEVRRAIGAKTSKLFKELLNSMKRV